MAKIEMGAVPERSGSTYPDPHNAQSNGRRWKALGLAGGLTQFGVNLVTLEPGVWSSLRHWHAVEDEFAYVLSGRPTLVEDAGETQLAPGDSVAWKGGVRDGHMLKNLTSEPVTLLVVGGRSDADWGEYSDVDIKFHPGRYSGPKIMTRKDGSPL